MGKNNVIPNNHFKKKWQFYVKTWFNQPARKVRRRQGEAECGRPRKKESAAVCVWAARPRPAALPPAPAMLPHACSPRGEGQGGLPAPLRGPAAASGPRPDAEVQCQAAARQGLHAG